MFVLDSVACADSFPADGASGGAQIIAQNGSTGGYFTVTGNDAYVQLAYQASPGASLEWTPKVHVGVGNGILAAGTRGIRFANYVAGKVATVSAGLSEPLEPPLQLTSAGVSASGTSNVNGITGKVSSAGAVLAGTGFSVVRSAAGIYVVTFAPALSASPAVVATAQGEGIGNVDASLTPPAAGGFTCHTRLAATAVEIDCPFDFVALIPQ